MIGRLNPSERSRRDAFAPVHVGQSDVHNDEIGRMIADRRVRARHVGGFLDDEFGMQAQLLGQRHPEIDVIVHNQDPPLL